MSEQKQSTGCQKAILVTMDGNVIDLPEEAMKSLAAIRAHLELIALRQDRVLAAFWVDGKSVNMQMEPGSLAFKEIQARTIGFWELGQELAATARSQAQALIARTENCVTMVLINPWSTALRLVQEVYGELRTLLVLVNFLQELSVSQSNGLALEHQNLLQHIDHLGIFWANFDALQSSQNNITLSDGLELGLLPWLQHLAQGLERWGETQ